MCCILCIISITTHAGQQVSIFGQDVDSAALILDSFGAVFGKVNLALFGPTLLVMSVRDALREFSVPTVVAHKSNAINDKLVAGLTEKSVFLETASKIQ